MQSVSSPINGARTLSIGSKPVDGGYLIFDAVERRGLLASNPGAERFLRPFIGAEEFLHGGERWILALQDASPGDVGKFPIIVNRLSKVRRFRLGEIAAKRKDPADLPKGGVTSRSLANTPGAFHITQIPSSPFLLFPLHTSEKRDYVAIGWVNPPTIPSNATTVLVDASLFEFGILTSAIHMAWLHHIGGKLESRYRYSIGLVYNNFPWPIRSNSQKNRIELLAQKIVDARALPKNTTSSLADLYDPDRMPAELRKAHRELDLAVDKLYRTRPFASDLDRVEPLFPLYEALVQPTSAAAKANKRTARRVKSVTK